MLAGLLPQDDFEGAEQTLDVVARTVSEAVDVAASHYAPAQAGPDAAVAKA
jgi:hypothetical protein